MYLSQHHSHHLTITSLLCQVWRRMRTPAPPRCVTAPSRRAPGSPGPASWPGRRATSGQPPGTEAGRPGSTRPPPEARKIGWAASVVPFLLIPLTLKVSGDWSQLDLASSALNCSSFYSPKIEHIVYRVVVCRVKEFTLFVVTPRTRHFQELLLSFSIML